MLNVILPVVLKVALAPLAKVAVGALGPAIRSLAPYNLTEAQVSTIFGLVGQRFAGKTPVYPVMGLLIASDVKDMVEGLHEATVALMAEYAIPLTAAQSEQILTAVAARMSSRAPVVA